MHESYIPRMDAIGTLNAGLAGRYTIEREIGAGGMAKVFLARDLRHERRVALKVIRPELISVVGAERFLSEIRVTATLQHPNLLPLFDSGEVDGLLFYVMPFVDGETLRQRLEREKQLPVEEAVRIAVVICSALDYAHRHGIIHRDLKPENVLLHEGQPMIADFGIALAISNAAGPRVTQTGISLGTPRYMSPEQAIGERSIDARTDIYSAGAMTYEMLTGNAPHVAATGQAIIAKLLTEEVAPVSTARRSVPAHVEAAVHRALQKLPADRFTTAREFADALGSRVDVAPSDQRARSRSLRPWIATGVGLVGVSIAAIAWASLHQPPATTSPTMQVRLGLPDSMALDPSTLGRSFDFSNDGTQVAYVGAPGVFVRRLSEVTPRPLTSDAATDPRFSHDGKWVAYLSKGSLRKVRVTGGPPEPIADSVRRFGWSKKGVFVFTRGDTALADLWRVNENGGRPERFVHQKRPNDFGYGSPNFFGDGDRFLVPVVTRNSRSPLPEIAVGRLSDGEIRYLNERGNHPFYLQGVLFYVYVDHSIMAAPFDADAMTLGTPVKVFDGVMSKLSSAELAVSANGTMVYLPNLPQQQLIEIDRNGHISPLPHAPGLYASPRYSPDGRRLSLSVLQPPSPEAEGASRDVWIYEIESPTVKQISQSHGADAPEWTRDGKRIGWSEGKSGLGMAASEMLSKNTRWRSADGPDTATTLVAGALANAFSPTADVVVCVLTEDDGSRTLTVVPFDSTRARIRIRRVDSPPEPRVSPDGHWVAYVARAESGSVEVYVSAMSASGVHTRISTGGGSEPVWNPRGGELFYRAGPRLISVKLNLGSKPRVGRPDTLPFVLPALPNPFSANYDVSRDGKRFLTLKSAAAYDQPLMITGWFDDVRKLLRAR